jgi:hypothetical protein
MTAATIRGAMFGFRMPTPSPLWHLERQGAETPRRVSEGRESQLMPNFLAIRSKATPPSRLAG